MNHLPAFLYLLDAVRSASVAVDDFDFQEDSLSRTKFDSLVMEQSQACLALIAYVTQNAQRLTHDLMDSERLFYARPLKKPE